MESTDSEEIFTCTFCRSSFTHVKVLRSHILAKHKIPDIKRKSRNPLQSMEIKSEPLAAVSNAESSDVHSAKGQLQNDIQCPGVPESSLVSNPTCVIVTSVAHMEDKDKCNFCGAEFDYICDVSKHCVLKHPNTFASCLFCFMPFKDYETVKEHCLKMHPERTTPTHKTRKGSILCMDGSWPLDCIMNVTSHCDVCNTTYSTKRLKIIHFLKKHLNAWAPCGFCDRKFQRFGQLSKHVVDDHLRKKEISQIVKIQKRKKKTAVTPDKDQSIRRRSTRAQVAKV